MLACRLPRTARCSATHSARTTGHTAGCRCPRSSTRVGSTGSAPSLSKFVDRSRTLTESNVVFDLDAGHSADDPRLRRLSSPTDLHETYWAFASESPIVDVVVDLLGPNVKFHHSKLNFKVAHGGEEVKWHQDIQFWPHTNYDLLTVGVFLEDVEPGMGEVGFVSGSHDGPLFDLYDGDRWVGALADGDLADADVEPRDLPDRTGGNDHGAQLPDGARLGSERIRSRPTAAAPDLRAGRCVFVHGPRASFAPRRGSDPRRGGAVGAPRPAAVSHAAVGALPADLRRAAARRLTTRGRRPRRREGAGQRGRPQLDPCRARATAHACPPGS